MNKKEYNIIWQKKKSLQKVYTDLSRLMISESNPGPALEVGAGICKFKSDLRENFVRLDIQKSEGLDIIGDAHFLPFKNNVFSKIFLFDVLHHLQCPILFFHEAKRVLKKKGRVIMVEPGITPVSKIFYKTFHQEPVEMNWHPSLECVPDPKKDPYDSNQAIPTLLIKKFKNLFDENYISFEIVKKKWVSLFAYPLSGGYKDWCLIPHHLVDPLLKFEEKLLPYLGPLMAFRLMIVLQSK